MQTSFTQNAKIWAFNLLALFFAIILLPAQAQIKPTVSDISYVQDNLTGHKLDLYIPPDLGEPAPCIVRIHGGGWIGGSKGNAMNWCDSMYYHGYIIADINYRLSSEAIFPAQIYDCKAAVRFLKANATRFNIDTTRIGAIGESAGGHLAALLGTSGGVSELEDLSLGNQNVSSRIHAVVDLYGPTDFSIMDTHIPNTCSNPVLHNVSSSPESRLLGCNIALSNCQSAIQKVNPLTYISSDDPPFLIRHGEADCTVTPYSSQLLYDSLITQGLTADLKIVPGAGHGGPFGGASYVSEYLNFFNGVFKKPTQASQKTLDCNNFIVNGNPESLDNGATWKYQSTDNGVQYDLQGILFKPQGAGPFPVVLINHGTGGSTASYSKSVAKEMVQWGYVCIAVNYTHSSGVPCGLPGTCDESEWGVSEANLLRGKKCLDLLSCVPYADTNCIMAFGHSRGAFITAGLAAFFPDKFKALAHTAGGASDAHGSSTISLDEAQKIKTPYLLHHGSIDNVVALASDADLALVLSQNGVPNQLYEYPGYGHNEVRFDSMMYVRTKTWFEKYGCITTTASGPTYPVPSGVYCSCAPTTGIGTGSVAPNIAEKPFVKGILVRIGWSLIEPNDDVYNWALLDAQIAAAKSYGKKVSLGIGNGPATPTWVYAAGAQKLQSTHPNLGEITIPVPWDEVFLKKWTDFIAQLGARYQKDTTITLVYITNSTSNGIEMQVPLNVTPSWASLGYSDAKIINSWKTVIKAFKGAFPWHYLSNDFHPVNGSNVVADSVYAYAIQIMPKQYGASAWWWTQKNTGVYPAQYKILQHSAQNAAFTGVQMARNGTRDSSAFGAGGFPTALDLAINNGVCYWEVWNQDILNSNFGDLLISPGPKAIFDAQIKGNSVNFINQSTRAGSFLWDFGDGQSSSDANPVHKYTTSGKYMVVLKASTACESSIFQTELNIIISGIEHPKWKNAIDVFPNPNQGGFWVKIQGKLSSEPEFELFDPMGRSIQKNKASGNGLIRLDYSRVNPGVYYLSVGMRGEVMAVKKVVIIP